MSYWVLIAEDEMPMRQEMKGYAWEELGCELVGAVSNGKKALECCRQHHVDILITDITMPVMDGIELTKILRIEQPWIKVVFLTCHRDFDYAKQAIQNKVEAYLVKMELSQALLFETMRGIIGSLDGQKLSDRTEKNKIYKEVSINASTAVNKGLETEKLARALAPYASSFTFGKVAYFLLTEHSEGQWGYIQYEWEKLLVGLEVDVEWIILCQGCIYLRFECAKQYFIGHVLRRFKDELERKQYLTDCGRRMYLCQLDIIWDMHILAEQTKYLPAIRGYHFYQGDEEILYIQQVKNHRPDESMEWCTDKMVWFMQKDIKELKDMLAQKQPEPNMLIDYTLNCFENYMSKEQLEECGRYANECVTLDDYLNLLVKCRQMFSVQKNRKEIAKAKKIIHENYYMQLTLPDIARQVGLSASYFSRIFSREVGIPYNEYLNQVRMKKAHELMKESNMKIYQIAEKVGISNYRYFSSLYKKWRKEQDEA